MARLNIAMLADQSQEVQVQGGDELPSDARALQIEQTESEIGQMDSAIDEAHDASQAIEDVADKLEKQRDVTEGAVQVAQEMMGYLSKRTGIKFRTANVAMESYKTGDSAKKEQVIKELRIASESFNQQVSIAQEGVLDKIANKLSLIMASNKSLAKDLEKVSKAYDAGTPREEALEDPAFASVLNPEDKETLSAQDIVNFAKLVKDKINGPKTMEAVNQVNRALENAKAIKGAYLVGEEITVIDEQIATLNKILDDLTADGEPARGKTKVSVAPLDKSHKDDLVKDAEELLSVKETQDALNQIKKTISRSGKGPYREIMDKAYAIHRILGQLMKLRFEVAHACVKYIKASTGKGGAVQAATSQQAEE